MLTTIPFSGFYYSLHDSALDDTLDQMFSDRASGCTPNNGLSDRAQSDCNWSAVRNAYAEEYAENFASHFGIRMQFESIQSPRYYNFTTDRIFCTISESEAARLFAETPEDVLEEVAKETFTSRDGFISSYSPDVAEWGSVEEWDHNQIGCLVDAYVRSIEPEFDQYAEYGLMEDAQCNGFLDDIICNNTPTFGRLYKVWEYLNNRAERA